MLPTGGKKKELKTRSPPLLTPSRVVFPQHTGMMFILKPLSASCGSVSSTLSIFSSGVTIVSLVFPLVLLFLKEGKKPLKMTSNFVNLILCCSVYKVLKQTKTKDKVVQVEGKEPIQCALPRRTGPSRKPSDVTDTTRSHQPPPYEIFKYKTCFLCFVLVNGIGFFVPHTVSVKRRVGSKNVDLSVHRCLWTSGEEETPWSLSWK
jgi:hypothetical protein